MNTPITGDLVRGALDLERTEHGVLPHRLPAWARAQIPDDQLATAQAQPSGVRLVLRTRATSIELDVADFAELPLPDRLHPDAATHRLIGARFAEQVFGDGGVFGAG